MVVLGALVREDCSPESKARVGTIVKVTPLTLSKAGLQAAKIDIEKIKKRYDDTGREYNSADCDIIRPGRVFSVRWQDDPTKITIHVAYDDCVGAATINIGTNSVCVVK